MSLTHDPKTNSSSTSDHSDEVVKVSQHFVNVSTMKSFVTSTHSTLDFIIMHAKRLHLAKILTGRSKQSDDRVGFDLTACVRREVQSARTLFTFGYSIQTDLFHPSKFTHDVNLVCCVLTLFVCDYTHFTHYVIIVQVQKMLKTLKCTISS